MLDILKFFHANAKCERVFTQIRKAKKETQGKMKVGRLNRVPQWKMLLSATGRTYLTYEPSAETLNVCKSATWQKLKGKNSDNDKDTGTDSE